MRDLRITSPASAEPWPGADRVWPSHNTDGVNIQSCVRVQLTRLDINNGDDCVVIYSGSNEQGRVMNRTTSDVHVEDVTCGHGHGVTVGSRTSAGISNLTFRRIRCEGSWSEPTTPVLPIRSSDLAPFAVHQSAFG